MKQGISLCMIVKDEEADLAACLASVQNLISEIVIVDTGSRDRTKEIASSFKAKLIDYTWNDDFSAARNISLAVAECEWILVLDADERLDRSDFPKIKKMLECKDRAYKLVQRHYRKETDLIGFQACKGEFQEWEKGWLGYLESSLVRLFPNDPRLKYRNCMHELVEDSVRDSKYFKLVESDIRIHHFDHARSKLRREWKKELYHRLGLKKTILMADSWRSHYELGLELSTKKEFEKALGPLTRAYQLSPLQLDTVLALGHVYGELGKLSQSQAFFVRALQISPNNFQATAHLAVVYMKAKRFDAAVKILSQALTLKPEDLGAILNLGEAYLNLGKSTEAKVCFEKAISLVPLNPRAKIGLGVSYFMLAKIREAEQIFKELQNFGAERDIVSYWLGRINNIEQGSR
jgi:tetratricopeptide (TPR) repeat protein